MSILVIMTSYNDSVLSGRSAVRVAHSVRDAGVVGSNPTAPIFFPKTSSKHLKKKADFSNLDYSRVEIAAKARQWHTKLQ